MKEFEFSLPSLNASVAKRQQEDCPLCGFRFSKGEAACGGCQMFGGCSMLKCPNCNYEFVTESKIVRWLQKWFRRS